MPIVLQTMILALCSIAIILTGVIWGGPWPPKSTLSDGRSQALKLNNMRTTSAVWLVVTLVLLVFFPVIENIWLRYGLLVLLPLLLGIACRQILLWRERSAQSQ